jgi:hypothetical protein
MIMHAMSLDQVRAVAPSVFAMSPHQSRSERYAYIPTIDVLNGLEREGFRVVKASQSRTRIPGKSDFTKHMLRLRHESTVDELPSLGGVVPEIVIKNSHDGTSAYQLLGAMFRFICLNGMVVADSLIGSLKVQHSGNVTSKVIEGSFEVLKNTGKAIEAAKSWAEIELSDDESLAFADAAHTVRFGAEDTTINPVRLLAARRPDDIGHDLWRTFNRVQENVIRGGLQGLNATGTRRVSSRAVRGIDGDIRLNTALWQLAESMAALKA